MDGYAARMRTLLTRTNISRTLAVIGCLVLTFGLFLPWFILGWGQSYPDVTGLDVYWYGANLEKLMIVLTVLLWIFVLANKPLPAIVAGAFLFIMMLYVFMDRQNILGIVLENKYAIDCLVGCPDRPLALGPYVSVTGVILAMATEFVVWRGRNVRADTKPETDS